MAKLSKAERDKLPASSFALPEKRMFPIHDQEHIKLAWDMVKRGKGISAEEKDQAREKIKASAKKAGIDTSDWDTKAMNDSLVGQITILDEAEGQEGPLRIRCMGTKANVVNDNLRLYPRDVLANAITDAIERYVNPGKMVGQSPHPPAMRSKTGVVIFDAKITNNVAKESNLMMDDQGVVFFDAEIIPTVLGKDLAANIRAGVPVGVSMRALGESVKRSINGVMVDVATSLDIQAFDFVLNPATSGSGIIQVLNDSQVGEILDKDPPETVEDGIQFHEPTCPSCTSKLNPIDPDNDGDIDFWECPSGCGLFKADNYLTSTVSAGMELRRLDLDDYDTYSQARAYMASKKAGATLTDGKMKGDDTLKPEDLIQMIKDDPAVRAAVVGIATDAAKPALDAVQAQKDEEAKAEATAKSKTDAKAFVDEKVAALKGKMDEKVIKVITDAVGEPETKEQAQAILDATLKVINDTSAAQLLAKAGFNGTQAAAGVTTIEFGTPARPWMDHAEKIVAAFDDYGHTFGKYVDPSVRKANKPFVDKLLAVFEQQQGYNVMADSAQSFETILDAVSITTTQLLNQPTVLAAVILQAFQDVESLQFLMADVFEGAEWRIPVETFTSAAVVNTATGLLDILVPEGAGIPESSINLTWQSYSPTWRRNAVSLTTDVVEQLRTGPARYEAIARAIYHIGEDKRRKLDNASYYEMILASDEYAPLVITNEAVAADHLVAVSNGTNVTQKALLNGKAALEATKGTNPLVRPRTKNVIQANGNIQAVTTNAFSITGGTTTQVMGYMDANGNIAGTGATYAVDWENGIVYFNATSGVDSTHLPTVSYSAVTNVARWNFTVSGGLDPATYYNSLLQLMAVQAAIMGSSPRFKKPNLALFSLNSATYVENAQIFYKMAQPEGTRLITTGNYFGERAGMNLAKINAPWVVGDGRILLTQKGATRYGVQTPYKIEGPYPKYDASGNIVDAKVWYGRENSVLCTPQMTDGSGNIINPVSRTIKIVQ